MNSETSIKEKLFMTLVKDGKADFILDWGVLLKWVCVCVSGERLGSILGTARKRGNLQPRSRVGMSG